MKLIIEVDTNDVTEKDAGILRLLSVLLPADEFGFEGIELDLDDLEDTEEEIEEVVEEKVEEIKPEKKKPVKKVPPKKKPEVAVELDPAPATPATTPAKKKPAKTVDASSMTADELNDFAKSVVKPEYAKHYLALLKELNVAKFSLVPADKVSYAYNKILEIQKNVVV